MLRVYPIAIALQRAAETDTVLPLAKPVTGVSGKVYNELLVPARTVIHISTIGYNSYIPHLGPHPRGNHRSISQEQGHMETRR